MSKKHEAYNPGSHLLSSWSKLPTYLCVSIWKKHVVRCTSRLQEIQNYLLVDKSLRMFGRKGSIQAVPPAASWITKTFFIPRSIHILRKFIGTWYEAPMPSYINIERNWIHISESMCRCVYIDVNASRRISMHLRLSLCFAPWWVISNGGAQLSADYSDEHADMCLFRSHDKCCLTWYTGVAGDLMQQRNSARDSLDTVDKGHVHVQCDTTPSEWAGSLHNWSHN